MKYRVVHKTEYLYSGTITQCHNIAHLRPRNLPGQQCLSHRLEVDPLPFDITGHEDFFGNQVSYFSIQQPHRNLKVIAVSELHLDEQAIQLPLYNDLAWDDVRARLANPREAELRESRQYVLDSPMVASSPAFAGYAEPSFPGGRPLLEAVHDLMQRVHREFTYDPGSRPSGRRFPMSSPIAAGSARILPIWRSRVCAAWAWLHAMSAAIWRRCRHPARKSCRAPMTLMPGSRSFCPRPAGWTSIPPTIRSRSTSISPRHGGAISGMLHR